MSTTAKALIGARTQLSGAAAALNSLANLTYVNVGTITFASGSPAKTSLACKVELTVTAASTASNKKVSLFIRQSLDGTAFETGPVSGTTTTDEPNLTYVGDLECNTAALQRKIFELTASACGGALPYAAQLIVKNETGGALASSGNDVYYSMIDGDLT